MAGVMFNYADSASAGQRLQQNDVALQKQNALNSFYQTGGPGVLSGDPNALNALSRIDPGAAFSAQSNALGNQENQLKARANKLGIIASAMKAVLDAPPGADKQGMWNQVLQNLETGYGIPAKDAPQQWDDAQADTYINTALGLKGQLEQQDKGIPAGYERAPQVPIAAPSPDAMIQDQMPALPPGQAPMVAAAPPQNRLRPIAGGPQDPATIQADAEARAASSPPITRNVIDGNTERTQQFDPKTRTWVDLGKPGPRFSPSASGATGAEYTPEDIDLLATGFLATGKMPPLGYGAAGAKARQQVVHGATEIAKKYGITSAAVVGNQQAFKANAAALSQVTKTLNQIASFEATAQKNADLTLSLLDKGVAKSGIPLLNAWIQSGRSAGTNDPALASFDLALTTFKNEYARVVNSATGGGVTTDSARAEIDGKISRAMTPEALRAVIATAKADMQNRTGSLHERANYLQGAIEAGAGGLPAPAEPVPGPTALPQGAAAPAGVIRYDAQGNRVK